MDREELKAKYKDEQVLCVKDIDYIAWLSVYDNDNLKALQDSIEYHGMFKLRYEAEINEDFKQIIPYVVVKNKQGKYFVTKRIGGDHRLVGSYSLGLGGHVNPCDMVKSENPRLIMDSIQTLSNCMYRELEEETNADIKKFTFMDKGAFVDKSQPVSKVHLCKLVEATYNGEFGIKEVDKLEGQWMSPSEIDGIYDKLEGWSKIACDMLIKNGQPRNTRDTRQNKKGKVR